MMLLAQELQNLHQTYELLQLAQLHRYVLVSAVGWGTSLNKLGRRDSIDLNTQKERFSDAYLHAVASAAGYAVNPRPTDWVSIDWTIESHEKYEQRWFPTIDVQMKSTSSIQLDGDYLSFPLEIKNHRELRGDLYGSPRILVMVHVPEDVEYWLQHSKEQLIVRHCGYWVSLREELESSNSSSVTVKIPRQNQFTVDALQSMMLRVGNGGYPSRSREIE